MYQLYKKFQAKFENEINYYYEIQLETKKNNSKTFLGIANLEPKLEEIISANRLKRDNELVILTTQICIF